MLVTRGTGYISMSCGLGTHKLILFFSFDIQELEKITLGLIFDLGRNF